MSGNRGNSLAKISCMVEHEFGIAEGDKQMLYQLMDKDLFLYPTADRVSNYSTLSHLNHTKCRLIGYIGTR